MEGRLAAAFKPLGGRPVDVFAMAEALSQRERGTSGGSSLLDDIMEFVPKVIIGGSLTPSTRLLRCTGWHQPGCTPPAQASEMLILKHTVF